MEISYLPLLGILATHLSKAAFPSPTCPRAESPRGQQWINEREALRSPILGLVRGQGNRWRWGR